MYDVDVRCVDVCVDVCAWCIICVCHYAFGCINGFGFVLKAKDCPKWFYISERSHWAYICVAVLIF